MLLHLTIFTALTVLTGGTLSDYRAPEGYRIPVGCVFDDFPATCKTPENQLYRLAAYTSATLCWDNEKFSHTKVKLSPLHRRWLADHRKANRLTFLHENQRG